MWLNLTGRYVVLACDIFCYGRRHARLRVADRAANRRPHLLVYLVDALQRIFSPCTCMLTLAMLFASSHNKAEQYKPLGLAFLDHQI